MLYISGDGCFSTKPSAEDLSYDLGGVLLSTKKDYEQLHSFINSKVKPHAKEPNCLYPGDLQPFTRRPTFVVVDSDNSTAFANIPRNFDQPLVVLMSPQEVPSSFRGKFSSWCCRSSMCACVCVCVCVAFAVATASSMRRPVEEDDDLECDFFNRMTLIRFIKHHYYSLMLPLILYEQLFYQDLAQSSNLLFF